MKAFNYLPGILILVLLSLFLPACTDTPIFYTLEKAYETADDRGLDDKAIVQKIVYTGAPAYKYFVIAQSLYQRDEGDSGMWQRVTPPAGGALCGGLEFFGGNIIAWFYNSNDLKPVGLYSRDPSSSPTAAWTGPITDGDWPDAVYWPGQKFRIHFLKAVNSRLFVSMSVYDSGAGTTTYNLYFSATAGSNSFTASNTDYGTDLDNQILDVEYDGTDYWFVTTPEDSGGSQPIYLYQNAAAGDPSDFDDVSAAGPPFWKNGSDDPAGTLYMPHSLYYAPAPTDNLYLSGWHGRIFIHSGGSWSTWPAVADQPDRKTVEVGRDDYTVQFTAFVETGQNSQLFVGSAEFGYFYFSDTLDGSSTLSPGDLTAAYPDYEYFPAELKNGAITSFLLNMGEDPDVLFACTSGAGLWRGDWNAAESLWIWKQE